MPRRAKIIATIGPASRGQATVRALIDAGVDAFRLNFSYGGPEEHAQAIADIRQASGEAGRAVAILQDLQGLKVRVGRLPDGPCQLAEGAQVTITTRSIPGNASLMPVSYRRLAQEVREGDRILLGDGEVELEVLSSSGSDIRARVLAGGFLKEGQGLNLPGVALDAEAITKKDLADVEFGLRHGVDYVALSYVRSADDMARLRRVIEGQGARIPLIAKLEKQEAIERLDAIFATSDVVMVARGDLGLELSPERVPLLQKEVIRRANERGNLVITATQMLESMVDSLRPTRAEASDVANAILDGTDAVMLSAETAIGRYPVQAVQMMARIIEEAERQPVGPQAERQRRSHAHAMSRAACELAAAVRAAAIVVFTRSGYSAHLVSKQRPRVPIFAFTPSQPVYRQLALWWGVTPLLAEFPDSVEEMIAYADHRLVEGGLLRRGDTVIVARWSPLRARGWANFVKMHRLVSI